MCNKENFNYVRQCVSFLLELKLVFWLLPPKSTDKNALRNYYYILRLLIPALGKNFVFELCFSINIFRKTNILSLLSFPYPDLGSSSHLNARKVMES